MTDDSETQLDTNRITTEAKAAPLARLGRPADSAKEAAILSAARRSFLELSYDRVSMDAIAERAGVSKVTLYTKYKSKDGLFVAAMSESCGAIYNQARTNVEVGGPIRETLMLLGTNFMMMILDPEVAAMHAVMIQISQSRPELPRQFYETAVNRSINTLAETLAIATDRGTLACPNPRQAAVQFIAMVQGVFRYQLELGVDASVTQTVIAAYVSSCVDLFLLGYGIKQSA